jgi:hypothetical protein
MGGIINKEIRRYQPSFFIIFNHDQSPSTILNHYKPFLTSINYY